MKNLARYLLLSVVMVSLAACSSDNSDEEKTSEKTAKQEKTREVKIPLPICPQVAVLRELEEVMDYGNEKPDPSQLVARAKMETIEGDCEYLDNGIDVKFDLSFVAERGPRLGGLHTDFPYFISILDPQQTILSKEKMTVGFGFSSGGKTAANEESLHVFIPLAKDKRPTAPNYQVLIGFQLTQDQLDAVRAQEKKDRD